MLAWCSKHKEEEKEQGDQWRVQTHREQIKSFTYNQLIHERKKVKSIVKVGLRKKGRLQR